MSPPILQIRTPSPLSFSSHIQPNFLTSTFSNLSITKPIPSTTIRMGGGPRTYPGGVSKWQWKRMQAKKSKQLLRARLARERQIYEMRKRAELNAAVLDLERPWEAVEKAPKLFSVTADEQLKYLADRFQKPGGFDLWSDKDGPQLFESVDGVTSARFFPKGVVHSVKPYRKDLDEYDDCRVSGSDLDSDGGRRDCMPSNLGLGSGLDSDGLNSRESGSDWRKGSKKGKGGKGRSGLDSKVFDMNLQDDGSYGISKKEGEVAKVRRLDRK